MTGIGGFPPNPQTVVRIGAPPKSAQGALVDKIIGGRRQTNAGLDDAPVPSSPKPPASNRRPQVDAAAEKPQVSQNVKDGDVFMHLGSKSVKVNSIRSLREAANHFRGAAEFYAAASEPELQRKAIKAADQADEEADRRTEARRPARRTRGNAAECDQLVKHAKSVKAGVDPNNAAQVAQVNEIYKLVALKGCNVD